MYRPRHRRRPVKELGGARTVLAEVAMTIGIALAMGLMFFAK